MNISGKYIKVWDIKEESGFKKVNLGDSWKDKNGEYQNYTMFDVMLLGEAKNVDIRKGDTVEIVSGMYYMEKYKDKWYPRYKVFKLAVTDRQYSQPNNVFNSAGFEDDIPF